VIYYFINSKSIHYKFRWSWHTT